VVAQTDSYVEADLQVRLRRYFSGMAGSRLSFLFTGSTMMPTDSSAVTPKIGSVPSGPKMTRPAVSSP
jgi:hypothetical protein